MVQPSFRMQQDDDWGRYALNRPSTFGESMQAYASSSWWGTTQNRAIEEVTSNTTPWKGGPLWFNEAVEPDYQPVEDTARYLTPKEQQESQYWREGFSVEQNITEDALQARAEWHDTRKWNDYILNNRRPGLAEQILGFGVGAVAGLPDPANLLPIGEVLGVAKWAEAANSTIGRIGRRAVQGAVDAGVGNIPGSVMEVNARTRLGLETSYADIGYDIALGALSGGLLGGAFGYFSRSRTADGKEIDFAPPPSRLVADTALEVQSRAAAVELKDNPFDDDHPVHLGRTYITEDGHHYVFDGGRADRYDPTSNSWDGSSRRTVFVDPSASEQIRGHADAVLTRDGQTIRAGGQEFAATEQPRIGLVPIEWRAQGEGELGYTDPSVGGVINDLRDDLASVPDRAVDQPGLPTSETNLPDGVTRYDPEDPENAPEHLEYQHLRDHGALEPEDIAAVEAADREAKRDPAFERAYEAAVGCVLRNVG